MLINDYSLTEVNLYWNCKTVYLSTCNYKRRQWKYRLCIKMSNELGFGNFVNEINNMIEVNNDTLVFLYFRSDQRRLKLAIIWCLLEKRIIKKQFKFKKCSITLSKFIILTTYLFCFGLLLLLTSVYSTWPLGHYCWTKYRSTF